MMYEAIVQYTPPVTERLTGSFIIMFRPIYDQVFKITEKIVPMIYNRLITILSTRPYLTIMI